MITQPDWASMTMAEITTCVKCPLCQDGGVIDLGRDKVREYRQCLNCQLVHVPPAYFVSPSEELAIYQHHQNDVNDLRYRAFLNRLCEPLTSMLSAGSHGLDFGCGPGPALAAMLRESGHHVELFDRFYHNEPAVLSGTYDFITATEVFEHLQQPREEIQRLWNCLRQGGFLGVMTKRIPTSVAAEFLQWFYLRDPTHVVFFHDQTFHWLAERLNADIDLVRSDVAILKKRDAVESG